jgi:hypothetical protein
MTQFIKARNESGNVTAVSTEVRKIKHAMNNFTLTDWISQQNGQISRNTKPTKTKSFRNRKSEQNYN